MFQDKIKDLEIVYQKLENETQAFQKRSGLHCLEGCGRCCLNPNVTTTVLEMIPVALKFHQSAQVDVFLQKIENQNAQGPCVLYESHSSDQARGRCGHYANRPLICRLFGFSAVRDKRRQLTLVTCKLIKEDPGQDYEKTLKEINQDLPVPLMAEYAQQVSHIDPALTREELPINLALKRALEKIGLLEGYQGQK